MDQMEKINCEDCKILFFFMLAGFKSVEDFRKKMNIITKCRFCMEKENRPRLINLKKIG